LAWIWLPLIASVLYVTLQLSKKPNTAKAVYTLAVFCRHKNNSLLMKHFPLFSELGTARACARYTRRGG
jgi:hypothetical protein